MIRNRPRTCHRTPPSQRNRLAIKSSRETPTQKGRCRNRRHTGSRISNSSGNRIRNRIISRRPRPKNLQIVIIIQPLIRLPADVIGRGVTGGRSGVGIGKIPSRRLGRAPLPGPDRDDIASPGSDHLGLHCVPSIENWLIHNIPICTREGSGPTNRFL